MPILRSSKPRRRSQRDLCQTIIDHLVVDDGSVHAGTEYGPGGKRKLYRQGKVIVNAEVAASSLPTTSGFFFGSTDYDEGYLADLHDTVEQIDRALKLPDDWYFAYRSSW